MTENQTTGSSDSNLEANLPSIEVLYPASMEPPLMLRRLAIIERKLLAHL